jgi:hypothetical protein
MGGDEGDVTRWGWGNCRLVVAEGDGHSAKCHCLLYRSMSKIVFGDCLNLITYGLHYSAPSSIFATPFAAHPAACFVCLRRRPPDSLTLG